MIVRRQQNIVKTVSESTSELSRDKTKTIKNRLPSARAFGRTYARVRKGFGDGSERRLGRPGLPTCRPKRPTWPPRRPTWRPRRPKLRPKAVPSASWSDLITKQIAQNRPRRIRHRFSRVLGSIFPGFSVAVGTIFVLFSFDCVHPAPLFVPTSSASPAQP